MYKYIHIMPVLQSVFHLVRSTRTQFHLKVQPGEPAQALLRHLGQLSTHTHTQGVSAGAACVPNTSKFVSFVRALYINFMQID